MNILTVKGDHFSCGVQIGQKRREVITAYVNEIKNELPENISTWSEFIDATTPYLPFTQKHFPLVIEELRGVAEGAGLPFETIFATTVEELWDDPLKTAGKACTDIIVTPPRSSSVLIGHNNDLGNFFADKIVPVLREYEDGSSLFTVGPCGYYVSVGINSFGLVLSGNHLTQTDSKLGVPRALITRAILSAKTIEEAVIIATHPERASSYNNIICTKTEVINLEESATTYERISPQNSILIHANHYVSEKMKPFEGIDKETSEYTSSTERQKRGGELVETFPAPITTDSMKTILASHYPAVIGSSESICLHTEYEKTVFSMIIDMATGRIEIALGNPCTSAFEEVWRIPADANTSR